jgi:hypothetical protein
LEKERAYYEAVARNIDLLTLEQALTHGGIFVSPQRVIETIEQLREQLRINHYIVWFRIPTLERSAAIKSMETFAETVIPYFRSKDAQDGATAPATEAVVG